MANAEAGWYDDGSGTMKWWDGAQWTEHVHPQSGAAAATGVVERIKADAAAGGIPHPGAAGMNYVVLQVILKEKLWGSGSGNLTELERAINAQAKLGYRLHTISTASSGTKGAGGGDRIQATMVFERIV